MDRDWERRSAYLLVQAEKGAAEQVWKEVPKWNDAIGMWLVTGPWDMLIWVDASSWDDLYDKVVKIRKYNGIKATSSHFVYKGYKGKKWWWEWPVGSWVSVRTPHLNGEWKAMHKWSWMASTASTPGDWDYLVWAGGKNWNEVWNHVWDLNKEGWHTQTMVPIRSWWNKNWKKNWW